MSKTSTIKVFILFLLSVLPLSAKGKLFEASTFYLDNGMQVILIENPTGNGNTAMILSCLLEYLN